MKRLFVLALFCPVVAFAANLSIQGGQLTVRGGQLSTLNNIPAVVVTIPVIDAQTISPSGTGGGSPLTWSHTISGTNRLMVLGCSTAFGQISGITVGGNAMTLSTQAIGASDPNAAQIWTLIAPPTGSQSIVATFINSSNNGVYCAATSFTGANQSTAVDVSTASFNSPGAGTQTATLTTLSANDMLLDVIEDRQGTGDTVGGGQTAFGTFVNGGVHSGGISTKLVTAPGTYSMTWTTVNAGGGGQVIQSVIAIKAAP